jgi:putative flippase GtrA
MRQTVVARIIKLLTSEFSKFVLVGGISAAIEFSLLYIFVEHVLLDVLVANTIAFILTNIVTFTLTKLFVFNSKSNSNKVQETGMFALCLLGGLIVNQIVMWTLVQINIDYLVAKVVAIAVTVIWNFFTRKYFVFRNREVVPQQSATSDFSKDNL